MKTEVATWVATAVGSPLIIVILCWTLVIYHYHRRHWQPVDLLVVAVIVQGIVKQVATFFYAILTLLQPFGCKQSLCSTVSWLLNSVHFLQAATLVTLTASRMLAIRYPLKYKQVVKRTHLTYHLVSLAVLATCIGIASVLAETKPSDSIVQNENVTVVHPEHKKTRVYCVFLPHELDQRFAVMSIAMHSFLNLASVVMLVVTGFGWCLLKKQKKMPHSGARKHEQLLKSDASVMSDSSMGSAKHGGGLLGDENDYNSNEKNIESSRVQKFRKQGTGLPIVSRNGFENGKPSATFVRNTPQNTPSPQHQTNSPNDQQLLCSTNPFSYNYTFSDQNAHVNSPTPTNIFKIPSISNCSNNTISKSLINGSNFEEMYDNIYAAHVNDRAENSSRWATESSCISSSTSSTNSRAPCLARHQMKTKSTTTIQWEELRLSTAIAVLGLCYIFNHVPALILSVVGTFVSQMLPPNWPLHLVFFWTGMAEECLLPVMLALFDDNFSGWVHATYTSDRRLLVDLTRHHQGLDGRFRIFNPPLADIQPIHQHHNSPQQTKFPITNGSLFTTVCGRHPVIHNYRRGKGTRLPVTAPAHCTSSGSGTNEQYLLQNPTSIVHHPAAADIQTSFTDESRKLLGDYRGFHLHQNLPINNEVHNEKNLPNLTLSDLQIKHSSLGCDEDVNSELTSFGDANEPIYATLSSRSCCSATTAANDDFEFYQHEVNSSTCCKSDELYFTDANISNIREINNKCIDDTVINGKLCINGFNDMEKLISPFVYDGMLHVCGKTLDHKDLSIPMVKESNNSSDDKATADESLLSAIENEIKSRHKEIKINSPASESSDQYKPHCQSGAPQVVTIGCDSTPTNTQTSGNCSCCDLQKEGNEQKEVLRDRGKKTDSLSPYGHKRYISKGFLKSLSVDNFDELNEELNYHKDTDVAGWGNNWCSEYQRQFSLCDFNATDRKEIIFELPGKRASINLNEMSLQEDRLPSKTISPNNICQELQEHLPDFYHSFNEPTLLQSYRQQKPPPQKLNKKRLMPVLSMESLLHAVNQAGISYLDNGELCQHSPNFRASTPDLKTVFVSDYL